MIRPVLLVQVKPAGLILNVAVFRNPYVDRLFLEFHRVLKIPRFSVGRG